MSDYIDKARLQAGIGAEHYAALTLSRGFAALMQTAVNRLRDLPVVKLTNAIAVDRNLRRIREVLKPIAVKQVRLLNGAIIGYTATCLKVPPYFPGVTMIYWPVGPAEYRSSSPPLFMISAHALGRILERTDDFPVQGVITILREVLPYGVLLGMTTGGMVGGTLGVPLRGGIGFMQWDKGLEFWVMSTFVSGGMLSKRQREALAKVTPLTVTPLELIAMPVEDIPDVILETVESMAALAAA